MPGEKVKFLEHFFFDPCFLVLSIGLELKPHREPIRVGPRGQKGAFLNFSKFFSKNHGFSVKKWKWPKNGQKIPKVEFLGFQTWFAIIAIPQIPKNEIFAIFGNFTPFFVIFCLPTSRPNLSGRDQKKSTFFVAIH